MGKHGFTLIEISIVLVIIGLIIGGVLTGRDLIRAAEVRGTAKQIEQFNASVTTFRLKYNCLPGDCASASNLGFTSYDPLNVAANGNGNGQINLAEQTNALMHLSQANLLTVELSSDVPMVYLKLPSFSASNVRGFWTVGYMNPTNGGAGNALSNGPGHYYWANTGDLTPDVFSPIDAYAIDKKMDDGLPFAGSVRGGRCDAIEADAESNSPYTDDFAGVDVAGPNSVTCVTNATPNQYNVLNVSRAAGSLCTMTVKTAF